MQCANLLTKRRLEPEIEPKSYRAKRLCLEAELRSADCPMETSHTLPASNQQQEQQVRSRPPLYCPRCLGGEPGHINHIMGQ